MRVMMSAAGSVVAPGIIRHLQKLGHYVIGHDCCESGYGLKLCDEAYYSRRGGPPDLQRNFDIYLPFLDEELRLLNGQHYKPPAIACSPPETLAIFTDKFEQQKAFECVGLPVAPRAHHGDIIAKPTRGRGGNGIIRTSDETMIGELAFAGYLVQRFIEGDEYTVDVLVGRAGTFLFAVPRLRIQAKGVSIIGRIRMDPELIDLAKRVTSAFHFAGPINIQMIREKGTGKLYIIELNPRLSGSCMFTVMAGFDILDATIRLFSGKPFVPPEKVEEITVRRYYVEERV